MARRLRYNRCYQYLDGPLAAAVTSFELLGPLKEGGPVAGVDIPSVVAPDILVIDLDDEVIWITDYTTGSTTVDDCLRGQENTGDADHDTGARLTNTITKIDIDPPPPDTIYRYSGTYPAVASVASGAGQAFNDTILDQDDVDGTGITWNSASDRFEIQEDGLYAIKARLELTSGGASTGAGTLTVTIANVTFPDGVPGSATRIDPFASGVFLSPEIDIVRRLPVDARVSAAFSQDSGSGMEIGVMEFIIKRIG